MNMKSERDIKKNWARQKGNSRTHYIALKNYDKQCPMWCRCCSKWCNRSNLLLQHLCRWYLHHAVFLELPETQRSCSSKWPSEVESSGVTQTCSQTIGKSIVQTKACQQVGFQQPLQDCLIYFSSCFCLFLNQPIIRSSRELCGVESEELQNQTKHRVAQNNNAETTASNQTAALVIVLLCLFSSPDTTSWFFFQPWDLKPQLISKENSNAKATIQ